MSFSIGGLHKKSYVSYWRERKGMILFHETVITDISLKHQRMPERKRDMYGKIQTGKFKFVITSTSNRPVLKIVSLL